MQKVKGNISKMAGLETPELPSQRDTNSTIILRPTFLWEIKKPVKRHLHPWQVQNQLCWSCLGSLWHPSTIVPPPGTLLYDQEETPYSQLLLRRESIYWTIVQMFRLFGVLPEGLTSFLPVSKCWWDLPYCRCLGPSENQKELDGCSRRPMVQQTEAGTA